MVSDVFYPLDFTFVCPTEITAYSKAIEDFKSEGAEVLGISVDSEHSHKAWINGDLGQLAFPLASDMTKKSIRKLWCFIRRCRYCFKRSLYN